MSWVLFMLVLFSSLAIISEKIFSFISVSFLNSVISYLTFLIQIHVVFHICHFLIVDYFEILSYRFNLFCECLYDMCFTVEMLF